MNEFSILGKALEEVVEPEINEYMNSTELLYDFRFSKKFERKMKRLIKRREKPYFKLICTRGRRIAWSVAALIMLVATSLRVEAVREAVHDFFMYIFKGHTAVSVNRTIDHYPLTIEDEYEISDLPAGFEQVAYYADETSVFISYENGEKYIFFQQMVYSDFVSIFDNAHSELEYYTDNSGQEYLIHDTGTDYCITFNDGKYIIKITSNLDKNEVVKLCKRTKIK